VAVRKGTTVKNMSLLESNILCRLVTVLYLSNCTASANDLDQMKGTYLHKVINSEHYEQT